VRGHRPARAAGQDRPDGKLDILARLHQQFGERRIDLVVYPDASRPFPRMVLEESVPL